MPHGIWVTYSNIGVFLTVTSATPAEIINPGLSVASSGTTNLTFGFGTASNQSYTVQQNTDLSNTNWIFVTNVTGNGSLFQFITPRTNIPELFFRVIEP